MLNSDWGLSVVYWLQICFGLLPIFLPDERKGVNRMADVIVILRIICAFVFGLSLGYRIGRE